MSGRPLCGHRGREGGRQAGRDGGRRGGGDGRVTCACPLLLYTMRHASPSPTSHTYTDLSAAQAKQSGIAQASHQ